MMASSTCRWPCARRVAALVAAFLLLPYAAVGAEGMSGADGKTVAAKAAVSDKVAAREAASALMVEGVALLHNNQYAMALAKFDAAYALVPSPNIHYNRGLAYAGLGKHAAALAAFEAFLAEADHPPEGKRDEAKRYRDDLSRRVAHVAITTDPPGLEVLVDGESYGTTPLQRGIHVDPGTHALLARLGPRGPTTQQTITTVAGQYLTITLALAPPPVAAAAAVSAPAVATKGQAPPAAAPAASAPAVSPADTEDDVARRSPPGWTYVAAAGGVALLGAGLTFGLLARADGNALTTASQRDDQTQFDPSKEIDGLRYQTLETICIVGGAAALAAGVVGYLIARPPAAERARAPKSGRGVAALSGYPLLGPSLAGARVMVTF
jgi:hypothetical protein